MLEKDAYTVVCDILKPESFYDPANQKIYAAIQTLGAAQQSIDMLTVTERLRLNGDLEGAGGALRISELTSKVASGAHVEFHARIVAQKYLARELIRFASQIEAQAFDESYDVDDLLQEAEGKLFEISQRNVKKDVTQIDPVINSAIEQIQIAANRASGLSGLESGYHELDKLTSGWQRSDLIIIAARPAMGKTAFVLSMAKNMAVNYNIPVAIFSLEMSNLQLVNRLIQNTCEIEGEKIKSGQLSQMEWDQLMSRVKNLYSAPLYIDDTASLSIFELRTKARPSGQGTQRVVYHHRLPSAHERLGHEVWLARAGGINDFALAQAVGQKSSTSPSWHSRSSTVRSSRAVPTRKTASVRSSPTFVNQELSSRTPTSCALSTVRNIICARASTELATTYAAWPSLSWPSTVRDVWTT